MKNKVFLISLAVVVAISLAVVGCCPAGYDKIVVGMSRSLTGPCAIIHESAFGALYPEYFNYVNNVEGGIKVDGCYFDVVADVRDDGSVPANLISNTSDLIADINAGKVHFLFGPSCPCFIDIQAPLANAATVTLMTFEGGTAELKDDPTKLPSWPYVFMHSSFSDWYQLPVLARTLAEAHQAAHGTNATPTAYICWQDDCQGLDYLNEAGIYFPANNITIVGNQSVQCSVAFDPDFIVAEMEAADPDIVCLFCYPCEVCEITAAAIGRDFNVDAWVAGLGGNFGWFGQIPMSISPIGFGTCAEGVICFATANSKTDNNAVDGMKWLYKDANTLGSLSFADLDFWGDPLYWAGLEMWKDAVEAVGTVDPSLLPNCCFKVAQVKFKDRLASYKNQGNGVNTVLGKTWYEMFSTGSGTGGGILTRECHTGEIGQWQNGYVEIIGYNGVAAAPTPNYKVTSGIAYPKSHWPTQCQ